MNVELMARNSMSSFHEDKFIISPTNLEDWSWINLRVSLFFLTHLKLFATINKYLKKHFLETI